MQPIADKKGNIFDIVRRVDFANHEYYEAISKRNPKFNREKELQKKRLALIGTIDEIKAKQQNAFGDDF
jgi:hypothetical protein